MQDDYKMLQRLGVSVKGKIVIARYGGGWRGLKPKLAQDHGAVGCIIYSDPAQDGYSVDETYPKGPMRPPHGVQRGSVLDMGLYPGRSADAGHRCDYGCQAAQDVGRADDHEDSRAAYLLCRRAGVAGGARQARSRRKRGAARCRSPITSDRGLRSVHLAVKSDWSLKPIYDVIATMKGSTWPDQWVVRGNHHDGWVFGATDPLSGQVALLAEAKAFGGLAKQGWRPKRTIVYTSWDAEEPMLLGSTEWAEEHAAELKQKVVLYINSDSNERGFLEVGGSQDFQHLVNQVAADVIDPETGVSIGRWLRAKIRIAALAPSANEQRQGRSQNRS